MNKITKNIKLNSKMNKVMTKIILYLLYLGVGMLSVSGCTDDIDLSKMNKGVVHFVLDNGLNVVLKEDKSNPVTAVHLRVKTGSIDETGYFGSGLSHFFEHSLFLGSKNHPEKDSYSAEIESYGGANVNAYTTFDHTAYHFTLLSKYTKEGLDCIEDLVFHPLFPKKAVENEMGSILSEMDMGDDNLDRVFSKFSTRVMFKKLPYKFPVIGYKEAFKKLTREELLAYYRKTYIPNNMILSVVGDFDTREIIEHIVELFSPHTRKNLTPPNFHEDDPWQRETAEISHPKANYPRVIFAWQTVSYFDDDMYPLDVLAFMLGNGTGSILYQRLKEEEKLVENIYAFSWTPRYKGVFEIAVDLSPTDNREEISNKIITIENVIQEELSKIKKGDIEDFRLNTVKRAVLTSAIKSKESVLGAAQSLAASVMVSESTHYDQYYLKRIEKVHKGDVIDAVKYLSAGKMKNILLVSDSIHQKGKVFANSILDEDIEKMSIELAENPNEKSLESIKKTAVSYSDIQRQLDDIDSSKRV